MAGAALEMTLDQFAFYAKAKAAGLTRADMRQPLTAVKVLLVADVRENFDQAHAPDGTAWLPLKNPSQRRGGSSSKPLRDTGLLMASVTAQGRGHVEQITEDTLVLGTNLPYAGVHQHGATIFFPEKTRKKPWVFEAGGKKVFTRRLKAHSVTIPARPFLGFSPRALDRIDKIFGEWLEQRLT